MIAGGATLAAAAMLLTHDWHFMPRPSEVPHRPAFETASPVPDGRRWCPGPRLSDVTRKQFAGRGRWAVPVRQRHVFLAMWSAKNKTPMPIEPDAITVATSPGQPYLVLFSRDGCAIGLLSVPVEEAHKALRALIGPAI